MHKEKNTIVVPRLLLPRKNVDYFKYAVIACDQFTSQKDYWDNLKTIIGEDISTLHMIFPEAYFGIANSEEYINKINFYIREYLDKQYLVDIGECFVLVERTLSNSKKRTGVVLAVDLEDYSYENGSKTNIRASEYTIVDRIPPRLEIRRNSPIELPHILFLYNDPENIVYKEIIKSNPSRELLYDFDLISNGGHIKGYKIDNCSKIIDTFNDLSHNDNNLLFVVGDGNHSLATAKAHWDNLKIQLTNKERENHPARYALVEAVNIHNEGIEFNPIHRVIFDYDEDFIPGLTKKLLGYQCEETLRIVFSKNENIELKIPSLSPVVYEVIQGYIDEYLKSHTLSKVDYVHDEKHLIDVVCDNKNSLGIVMPSICKSDIFDYISKGKILPRKTFSLGVANDKRYYLEGRRIK